MKKFKNILAMIVLFLVIAVPIAVVAVGDSDSIITGLPSGNLGNGEGGFSGIFAYRIGLGKCDNEEVPATADSRAVAVQQYAAKYYTPILGPSAYYCYSGSGSATRDGRGNAMTEVSSPVLTSILSTVASGGGSNEYMIVENGVYRIKPEPSVISQVMGELRDLGGANVDLYNMWMQEATSADRAKNPVIIVIEICGQVSDDGEPYWMSAGDLCYRIGGAGAWDQLVHTDLPATYGSAGDASITCNAIATICNFAQGTEQGDDWPYRATKRFFNLNYKTPGGRGYTYGEEWGYSHECKNAWQTLSSGGSEQGINGVTVVAIGGSAEGIYGSYTWHINAAGLPANSSGYQEDNTSDYTGSKTIGVGAIDIKQTNVPMWQSWMEQHPGPYEIKMEKYWTAGTSFSLDYNEVTGNRSSGTNSLTSGKNENSKFVSKTQLQSYITGGSDLEINGMQSGPTDVLGGGPIGGNRYQVSYTTKVTIIASDGSEVPLTNNDVHFAIYGKDSDRTYKYNQILSNGRSQVKQGDTGLDSEEYEAMSGTPTTKDLFVTQGGEQYIVQCQFRYVNDDYQRKYRIRSKEDYPNFLYYKHPFTEDVDNPGLTWDDTHNSFGHYVTPEDGGDPIWVEDSDGDGTMARSCYDGPPESKNDPCTDPIPTNTAKQANQDAFGEMESTVVGWLNMLMSDDGYDSNWDAADNFTWYEELQHYKDTTTGFNDNDAQEMIDNLADIKANMNHNTVPTGESKTFTLFKAQDLDSGAEGEIIVTIEWDCVESEYTDATNACQVNQPTNNPNETHGHSCESSYKYSYSCKLTVSDNGIVTNDSELKKLKFDSTLTQTFKNVKYLDIVQATLYRLEKGKQVGLGPILANTPAEDILEMAVEKMGYVLYDSEQSQARQWRESEREWRCISAEDLERTGRILNSVHKEDINTTLPDGTTFVIEDDDKDEITAVYDMVNGGRSHIAMPAYFARVAGNVFYEVSGGSAVQRRNTIFISSDVLAINTGDTGAHGWETFCFNDVDTDVGINIAPLQQYLMEDGTTYKDCAVQTFEKNDHSSYTRGIYDSGEEIFNLQRKAFNRGIVPLNNLDQSPSPYALKYNKRYMAEDNPYTFVRHIPEVGGITWVGYRGDYLTTTASHVPELRSISSFTPNMSKAISQMAYHSKRFPSTMVKKVDENVISTNAFPHKEGLNVTRTQDNGRYTTGFASLLYSQDENIDHTALSGVLPLAPMYQGLSLRVQDNRIGAEGTGSAVRATYDESWETPNDVVIFNPSTAENSYVYKLSDYMPDVAGNGGDDGRNAPRDQRASGYYIGTTMSNGIFVEGQSGAAPPSEAVVSTRKEMKVPSSVNTSYYTINKDYNTAVNNHPMEVTLNNGGKFTAVKDATYTFTVYDNNESSTTVRVYLHQGDVVLAKDNVLYKKARAESVSFADYINGTRVTSTIDFAEDNPYIVNPSRVDTFDLSGLGTIYAGDVLHLHYEFTDGFDPSNPPFSVDIVTDNSSAIDTKVYQGDSRDVWDYYVEFKEDCIVSALNVTFNVNTMLYSAQRTPIINFVDSFIMSPGNAYSNPANQSTTIDFIYLNNRSCAYNHLFADYDYVTSDPLTIVPYKYYISYTDTSVLFTIKGDSARDPHVVYNANWKYYVVGWKTKNGNLIMSPTDSLLDMDDTVLMWPSGIGEITVGELKNSACLVKYNDVVYVTTREAGLEHKIMEKGWDVTEYDLFTFDYPSSSLPIQTVQDNGTSLYPLQEGLSGANLFYSNYYEFFFQLSSGSGSDGYLYDVKYASNPEFKYSKDDVSKSYNREKWTYDWDEVTETSGTTNTGMAIHDFDRDATYLSLDDGFKIHFDNIGDYYETDWHNAGSMNVDLGFGFVNSMNTITWIKDKYMVFPFDVYVYGKNDTYGTPDPSITYEEYMSGSIDGSKHVGSPRIELTFVPAGTRIDLGHYEGDSGAADNAGHYIDFGANNGFDYEFWVCLSSSEMKSAYVKFVSSNINNNGSPEASPMPSNRDYPSATFARAANARRNDPISVVGRIGNLTMLDTGDYRFSDSFKTTSPSADWLVYGLIKKLDDYSNAFGVPSTQKALLLDPWDVRGRLGIRSLVGSDYDGYVSYDNPGYSTYLTQWHKVGDKTRIESLPLTSQFNEHQPLKLIQQKIGYDNLLTLDSIGNYYGSSQYYSDVPEGSGDEALDEVNQNHDFGNMKVQVRPYYILVDTENNESYPVDVYMKTNDGYKLINTGQLNSSSLLTSSINNPYFFYLENNTEEEDHVAGTYRLDQNMLRRMVTDEEAKITWTVLDYWKRGGGAHASKYSMLTNIREFEDQHVWDIENRYTYGNGQYMFLRDRNRTFVGANSIALNYDEPDDATNLISYKSHAQMWYFDLGLPSSAVFVRSGTPFNVANILNKEGMYVLSCVDVYAMGSVWDLHYKSPVSEQDLEFPDGGVKTPDEWNPVHDELPWLVPVTIYDASETTAQDDLNTEGTH